MASENCICKFLATWTAAWHDLWFVAANCLPSRCIAAKHMSHASSPVEKSLRKLKRTKGLGIFQSAPRLCDIFRWGSHGVGHRACILEACCSPFWKPLLGKPQSEGHPRHGRATEIPNQWALVASTWWASKFHLPRMMRYHTMYQVSTLLGVPLFWIATRNLPGSLVSSRMCPAEVGGLII